MGQFADILSESAAKTDEELASDIASVTTLKDSDVASLFPQRQDKINLLKLLDIVNAATSDNQKVAELTNNVSSLAAVSIKLIKFLI